MKMSKYQRDMLGMLREKGFAVDMQRWASGSHLFLHVTSPTGAKDVVTIPRQLGDYRAIRNFEAKIRNLLR